MLNLIISLLVLAFIACIGYDIMTSKEGEPVAMGCVLACCILFGLVLAFGWSQ